MESAIKNLEQRGLDRVLSYGKGGFARMVCLSVAAANVHRIGLILQKRERKNGDAQAATRAAQRRLTRLNLSTILKFIPAESSGRTVMH